MRTVPSLTTWRSIRKRYSQRTNAIEKLTNMTLPVNIDKLLSDKIVESERIEYKTGWNPAAVYRTICAFANDFSNIGGGYVIIGAKANHGIAERPVEGVEPEKIDAILKEMTGLTQMHHCMTFLMFL